MQSKAKLLFIVLVLAVVGALAYGFLTEPQVVQTSVEQPLDASKFGQ